MEKTKPEREMGPGRPTGMVAKREGTKKVRVPEEEVAGRSWKT